MNISNCHSNGFVPYDESVLGGIVPKLGRKLIYLLFVDVTTAQPTGNVIHFLYCEILCVYGRTDINLTEEQT